jgi:F-type H+-transporting ATPase subunit b
MSALFAAFGINWHLLLIQAVNFALLLAVLTYFLYRPILKMIDERQAKIAEGVRMAQEAGKRLEDAKSEGESLVGSAAREAEGLVAAARTRADEKGTEIVSAAQVRADALMKEAAAHATEAKRQALAESEREVAKAAMLAAEKILATRS